MGTHASPEPMPHSLVSPPINQTRNELMATTIRHTTLSHIGYLRGKPASEWIDAISKRRRPREHTP
jgi:hypothetical protein